LIALLQRDENYQTRSTRGAAAFCDRKQDKRHEYSSHRATARVAYGWKRTFFFMMSG
jgi:hypothetical protein